MKNRLNQKQADRLKLYRETPADWLSVGDLNQWYESSRQPVKNSGEFEHLEDELVQRLHDGVCAGIVSNVITHPFIQLIAAAAAWLKRWSFSAQHIPESWHFGTIRRKLIKYCAKGYRLDAIYPRPRNRTNCYKSFIHHALLKYQ